MAFIPAALGAIGGAGGGDKLPTLAVNTEPIVCFCCSKDIRDVRTESNRVVLQQGRLMDKEQADDAASSCCCCGPKKAPARSKEQEIQDNRAVLEAFQRFLLSKDPVIATLALQEARFNLAERWQRGEPLYADEVANIKVLFDKLKPEKPKLVNRVKQMRLQSSADEQEQLFANAAAPAVAAPAVAAAAAASPAPDLPPPSPLFGSSRGVSSESNANMVALPVDKISLFVKQVKDAGIVLTPFDPRKIRDYLTNQLTLSRQPSEAELQDMIKGIKLSLIYTGKPFGDENERVVDKPQIRKAIAYELSRHGIDFKLGAPPPSKQVAEWLKSPHSLEDVPPQILDAIFRGLRPSSDDHKEPAPALPQAAAPSPAAAMVAIPAVAVAAASAAQPAVAARPAVASGAVTPRGALETGDPTTLDF